MLEFFNFFLGKYYIEVLCMIKDGNYIMFIYLIDIYVILLWYKMDWFIILCCIFFIGGIIVGMFIFNIRKEVKI